MPTRTDTGPTRTDTEILPEYYRQFNVSVLLDTEQPRFWYLRCGWRVHRDQTSPFHICQIAFEAISPTPILCTSGQNRDRSIVSVQALRGFRAGTGYLPGPSRVAEKQGRRRRFAPSLPRASDSRAYAGGGDAAYRLGARSFVFRRTPATASPFAGFRIAGRNRAAGRPGPRGLCSSCPHASRVRCRS